ncbi:MAG: DinB family protein [Chloroflexi bacterium]|nr:DinB family protein [Chloroflexota bacterium]
MPKQNIIAAYERARSKLLRAIEGLSEEEMLIPGAVGYWSVKDVLAHLTAWESELITGLVHVENKKKGAPTVATIEDIDEWNEEQYHTSAARELDVVWEDFQGVAKHLIEAINVLDDKALDDNRSFPWMEGEPLSYLIYENAIWHEEEHAEDIINWRNTAADEPDEFDEDVEE